MEEKRTIPTDRLNQLAASSFFVILSLSSCSSSSSSCSPLLLLLLFFYLLLHALPCLLDGSVDCLKTRKININEPCIQIKFPMNNYATGMLDSHVYTASAASFTPVAPNVQHICFKSRIIRRNVMGRKQQGRHEEKE